MAVGYRNVKKKKRAREETGRQKNIARDDGGWPQVGVVREGERLESRYALKVKPPGLLMGSHAGC